MKKLADISQFESICGLVHGCASDLSVFNLSGPVMDFDDLECGRIVFDTKRGWYVQEVWRKSDPSDIGYNVGLAPEIRDGQAFGYIYESLEEAKSEAISHSKTDKTNGKIVFKNKHPMSKSNYSTLYDEMNRMEGAVKDHQKLLEEYGDDPKWGLTSYSPLKLSLKHLGYLK